MWVAEALDYGCKDGEKCPPIGRVSFLEDRDGDGKFETSTVFLDKISEPFGVTVWGKGVLISAAPDLIYAEDTNGDGKADVVKKLFTGFSVENPQARINSMCYGLDGWLEAGSYEGSKLKSLNGDELTLPNGDFRLQPDRAEDRSRNRPHRKRPRPRRLGQLVRHRQQQRLLSLSHFPIATCAAIQTSSRRRSRFTRRRPPPRSSTRAAN